MQKAMTMAREAVIRSLSERVGNKMRMTALAKDLVCGRVLGFGVEPKDVVYALEELGQIVFDRETRMVYLVRKFLPPDPVRITRTKCRHRLATFEVPTGKNPDDVALRCIEDDLCPLREKTETA